MYKAYVVDDEAMILSEIFERVPWLENGLEVCGYSTSPYTAIEEICALQPHVVFTDLKMPAMSGLDMISLLQKKGVKCEFIIISAYHAFFELRDFFRQGGFDYILKPIQQEDIQLVLEKLYNKLIEQYPQTILLETEGINPSFVNLVEYVRENYNQKLSLKKLAIQFDLSLNYICNLFSKHEGTTLTKFITELRMKEAGRLIVETSKVLKVVAIDCGYIDYYYFCKVFKEYYGLAPSEYRKKNRR